MTQSAESTLKSILAALQSRPVLGGAAQSEESLLRHIYSELAGISAAGYSASAELLLGSILSHLTGGSAVRRVSKEFLVRYIAGSIGQQSYETGLSGIVGVLTEVSPPGEAPETSDDQVDTGSDDGFQNEANGLMNPASVYIQIDSFNLPEYRKWGALRFHNGPFPSQGAIITVAYLTVFIHSLDTDDANVDIYAHDAASPVTLTTTAFDITNRPRTDAGVPWVEDGLGTNWHQSPSLVNIVQELVNSYSPTALMLILKPRADVIRSLEVGAQDLQGPVYAAKLHLEWTEP